MLSVSAPDERTGARGHRAEAAGDWTAAQTGQCPRKQPRLSGRGNVSPLLPSYTESRRAANPRLGVSLPEGTHGPVNVRKAAGRIADAGAWPPRPAGEALDSNETETVSGVRAPFMLQKPSRFLSPETLDEGICRVWPFFPASHKRRGLVVYCECHRWTWTQTCDHAHVWTSSVDGHEDGREEPPSLELYPFSQE